MALLSMPVSPRPVEHAKQKLHTAEIATGAPNLIEDTDATKVFTLQLEEEIVMKT